MYQDFKAIGTLVRNPETKETKNGGSLCTFTIAVKTGYGKYEQTDFVPCVAFGKIGESVAKYFQKGSHIIITKAEWHNNPFAKNEKGYDIPNWQCSVFEFKFPPKPKAVANGEDSLAAACVAGTNGFSPMDTTSGTTVEGGEDDLPF